MTDQVGDATSRRVLLADGFNLLYRAFTSLPPTITDGKGRPINAVYGALNAILRYGREQDAGSAVLALDTPEVPTFRHELFPGYQAQRGPLGGDSAMEFMRQVALAAAVAPAVGIPVVAMSGYEADDIMASYAVSLAAAGHTAIIITTDRDLLQMVRPRVEVLTPGGTGIHARTAEDVKLRLGVSPDGITTWKSLAGDASDNIPGVRGIGTKSAAMLVERYGSLEKMYADLESLAPRLQRLLREGQQDAFLFREIVTVRTDLAPPQFELPIMGVPPGRKIREIIEAATDV